MSEVFCAARTASIPFLVVVSRATRAGTGMPAISPLSRAHVPGLVRNPPEARRVRPFWLIDPIALRHLRCAMDDAARHHRRLGGWICLMHQDPRWHIPKKTNSQRGHSEEDHQ